MKAPEKIYLVIETRPDGTQDTDGIEFKTFEEANNHAIELVAKKAGEHKAGYSYTVDSAVWVYDI